MYMIPIVLFDGECNYCNLMVKFSLKWTRPQALRFASLQSEVGKKLKEHFHVPAEVDSVIFIESGQAHLYSTAALRVCRYFRFPASLLSVFLIVPLFIRQPFYKWIARRRYNWFGKSETCRVPTPSERHLFINNLDELAIFQGGIPTNR